MEENKKVLWIDQLRGIAIFLVILGPVELPDKINGLIYSFHMPLFFIFTGLTMKNKKFLQINMQEYVILCRITKGNERKIRILVILSAVLGVVEQGISCLKECEILF